MSVESFKAAGAQAFADGHYKAAVAQFTDAIKLMEKETFEKNKDKKENDEKFIHPQAAALYSNRSMCFAVLDKYLEALYDSELCIASKPDWWKAHARKATAMEGLGRYPEAEASLKETLRLDPNNAEITTKLRNISAVVAKQQREKAKPSASTKKAATSLPSPKIVGDWHETANTTTSSIPALTRGSRSGKKLTIRPSILDFAPTDSKIKNAPMFFPAAPEWPQNTEKFMNEVIVGATDAFGRAPPVHETRMLVDLAANAYLNQKQADDAYRKANNIKPTCDFCGISLLMQSPPSCECGELYCSRQCMELHWADHKKICETIRSQSSSLAIFHRMYWEACGYGEISWAGQRIKNYSVQYHDLVKEKKRKERDSTSAKLAASALLSDAGSTTTTTSTASSVCGNPPVPTSSTATSSTASAKKKKSENGHGPDLDEKDIEDLDEFSYLMLHERTALVRMCTDLQAISQKAAAEGDLRTQNVAITDLCAALIETYLRYSYLDKKRDSVQRVQFKIAMLEMLMTVLIQFNLARHVESLDASTSRFEDVIKSASSKEAASPEALAKFIEANGPSATTFSNEVLAAMKESS